MVTAVPSRVSLFISILRLNLVLTSAAASIYLFKPPYAIRSDPSSSGHANAYRWRSLPRVYRHWASKPQSSSKRVLLWQFTMDQSICASLSHTHYWYEVGMLKAPAEYPPITATVMRLAEQLLVLQIVSVEATFSSQALGAVASSRNKLLCWRLYPLGGHKHVARSHTVLSHLFNNFMECATSPASATLRIPMPIFRLP